MSSTPTLAKKKAKGAYFLDEVYLQKMARDSGTTLDKTYMQV